MQKTLKRNKESQFFLVLLKHQAEKFLPKRKNSLFIFFIKLLVVWLEELTETEEDIVGERHLDLSTEPMIIFAYQKFVW
ncbi:hypothetical protein SGRA_2817 [Saprospira grandis str. Lewin]|uniref:Uncharacterized protein n=1 Tax=Saprospira grandis (strain Lewin) TaxID=984262 RepID=H6LA77_SAPGL|nr:hypothetical protein SGRA_2817 [Saprospira grandis str. Lewin]